MNLFGLSGNYFNCFCIGHHKPASDWGGQACQGTVMMLAPAGKPRQ